MPLTNVGVEGIGVVVTSMGRIVGMTIGVLGFIGGNVRDSEGTSDIESLQPPKIPNSINVKIIQLIQ